ncbi:E3 ubiquitin-protein ligase PUB24-like [Salvia miltiorrhiza]|uniref:E3 ubiquitin-protein ligase PUB24-like n=1 Tax=Salvia miltiorrhiza TaxID=226208 RepID=UPI0025ACE462|nr:E3 ubiquitin-protein ligase PUB24-like [Salvia miltiorrhiza]
MENVEVPEYFICPISLQLMTDPVTVSSGITYDRHSIEQWLFTNHNTICPVTKHPLPLAASLTPNHTLRRLIHAWLTLHTPAPLTDLYLTNLIRGLSSPQSRLHTLRTLEALALESDANRAYMAKHRLPNKLISFVAACRRKAATEGLAEALSILYTIRGSGGNLKTDEERSNGEIIDALMWVFEHDRFRGDETVRSHAAHALRAAVEEAGAGVLERLKPEFFRTTARGLREGGAWEQALLRVLLEACPWGRNRAMMVESGTVFEVVEVELRCPAEKKTTELVLGIIYQLCLCAEGRAQLLSHAAGIAVVTRRILQVSAAADDRAVLIIWQISKYAASKGVVEEMVRVGTVTNLCLLMLADTASYLKEKARKILRMHFDAWKHSPCIEIATITRYTT